MPHDDKQSDLWWHDAIMPTCIAENWLHCIRDLDMSMDEVKVTIDKALVELKKNREVLREVYLEKRRLEGVKS
ncbi:MAG: hypothetical protein WC365_01315 [Candidatus Babeliales bacterium]